MRTRKVVELTIGCTLLALVLWLLITRIQPDSGDELIGLLIYGSIALSLFTDAAIVLLPQRDGELTAWRLVLAEIALRIAAVILLLIGTFTFLPAPGYQIDYPLVFAGGIIALAFVLEVSWRTHTVSAIDTVQHDTANALTLAFVLRVLMVCVVVLVGSGVVSLLSRLVYASSGALSLQRASIYIMVAVPPIIMMIIYLYYRLSRAIIVGRASALKDHYLPFAALLVVTALALSVILRPSADSNVTVIFRPEQTGYAIPADFLGLSFEAPVLMDKVFETRPATLVQLLTNLGQGTLRFGGNAVETIDWSPQSTLPTALGRAHLDSAFAFARRINWRVILGLNFGRYDPASAADEAEYAVKAGGSSLMALELGNEPDLFMFNRQRSPLWSYVDFKAEYSAYIAAIRGRVPDARIAGPVTYGSTGLSWFRQALIDMPQITLATHHLYPLVRLPIMLWGSPTAPTIDNLLSAASMARLADTTDELVRQSRTPPLQISETNSVANSGKSGVSDVFASTLWGTDYLFMLADHGVRGINFHTVFDAPWPCYGYTPICHDGQMYRGQPLYYAMLVFHDVTGGAARTVPVEIQGSVNVAAHAVRGADRKIRVILLNKEQRRSITVNLRAAYSQATISYLLAPSPYSGEGITYRGRSVQLDGTWTPDPDTMLAGNSVELPPCSAAIVTFDERSLAQ
jgi:hypothetical protein